MSWRVCEVRERDTSNHWIPDKFARACLAVLRLGNHPPCCPPPQVFSSLAAARKLVADEGLRPFLLLHPKALPDFDGLPTQDPNAVGGWVGRRPALRSGPLAAQNTTDCLLPCALHAHPPGKVTAKPAPNLTPATGGCGAGEGGVQL